jgi:outer membrane receptor protein involved in Fe transport
MGFNTGEKLMRRFTWLLALVLVLGVSSALWGQSEGRITGIVTDPTGAVVSGASVTAVSTARETTRTTATTSSGAYTITGLVPGAYKVTVSHPGFAELTTNLVVAVGQSVGWDPQLKVGSGSETVEVTSGGAATVNTETQSLQQVITATQISELPSLSRDAYSMVGTSGMVAADPSGRGTGYAINGLRSASTTVLLDGAENMDYFTASYANTIPMDSVQEFSVITNSFTAEFGRASAGVVNVATKSGTNSLHGSAYEFNRNSALASNSYQNAATVWDAAHRGLCASVSDPTCPGYKGHFNRNQFGGSVGGPIIKNKLFFFTNMEWLRIRSSGSRQRWVLTPQFIATLPANVQQFMAIGKLKSDLTNTSVFTASQLQGVIKAATGSTFANFAAANPNMPVFQGVNWIVPQDLGAGSPTNNLYNVSRIDLNVSGRTQFYGRFALDKENFFASTGLSPYTGYDIATTFQSQNWSGTLTHSFTNTLTSQTKIGYQRETQQQPLAANPAGPTLYMNSSSVPSLGGKRLDFPGYLPEGPGTAVPFGGPQNVYQFNEDVSWVHGNHQFRFGGQYTHLRDNHVFGAYENAVEDLSSSSTATSFNNLLTGTLFDFQAAIYPQGKFPCPVTINPTTGAKTPTVTTACQVVLPVGFPSFKRTNRYQDFAFYGQDSWKITNRLTVNLGLRWEYYGVQHNSDPSLDSNFYLGTGDTYDQQIRNGSVMLTQKSPVGGLWKPYYKGFGPRAGFAWDVFGNGRTSIRGGYALSYERNFGNVTYNVIQNPPNYAVISLTAADVGAPILVTTNNAGPLSGTGVKTLPAVTLRNPKQDIKPAYGETWNLTVEHELAPSTVMSVSYAGSHGVHLYSITNINRTGFGQMYEGDPFSCANKDIGSCGNRLNLQYSSANSRGDQGYSSYNAMNIGLRSNSFRKSGLTLTMNYTWSHTIDNISNTFAEGTNSTNLGLLDPFMPSLDKGNSEFDVRHRLTMSAIWNVPYFEHSENRLVRHVLGGWEFIPLLTARTGEPFSIFDCSAAFTVCPRYMPTTGPTGGSGTGSPASLYSPTTGTNVNQFAYFTLPNTNGAVTGAGAYGNPTLGTAFTGVGWSDFPICTGLHHVGCTWPSNMTQRDAFRGPNNWNWDFATYKNIKITERFKVQLRGEMYDFLNHKNFYLNSGTYDVSGNKGVVNVTKSDNRRVQLGVRLLF